MTTFSIIDITPAGALCNAIEAASESDRRQREREQADNPATKSETATERQPRFATITRILSATFSPFSVFSRKMA